MDTGDLAPVVALADRLFPDHPEDAVHFGERLARGTDLCLSLCDPETGIAGYAIAYPWPLGSIPALNRPLATLDKPNSVYLHDLGIAPAAAKNGHARTGAAMVGERARARGYARLALVAVNRSVRFWEALGFAVRAPGAASAAKLADYGAEARYMVKDL